MRKLVKRTKQRAIPISFLFGDLPRYVHIVEIKPGSSGIFSDITPTLGAFHQQCLFNNATNKRFRESRISEVLVSTTVIADGLFNQALKTYIIENEECAFLLCERP